MRQFLPQYAEKASGCRMQGRSGKLCLTQVQILSPEKVSQCGNDGDWQITRGNRVHKIGNKSNTEWKLQYRSKRRWCRRNTSLTACWIKPFKTTKIWSQVYNLSTNWDYRFQRILRVPILRRFLPNVNWTKENSLLFRGETWIKILLRFSSVRIMLILSHGKVSRVGHEQSNRIRG